MEKKEFSTIGIKFYLEHLGKEVARAHLYILKNDLHIQPFGFMEDVFVDSSLRGQGYGSKLVNTIIKEAKDRDCYKLICTSRHVKPDVHKLYQRLGFTNHGLEFRIDF